MVVILVLYARILRDPKNVGDAGPHPLSWCVHDFIEIRSSPRVTLSNVVRSSRSNGTSVNYRDPRKNLTSRVPPFKVTQGHWNRHGSIGYPYDFPLVIHSNHGPISYRFREINGRDIVTATCPCPDRQKSATNDDNTSIRLDTVPALERQTEIAKQYCDLLALHADARAKPKNVDPSVVFSIEQ